MCPLTLQGNALLGSQFVLAWVQRISNFGSLDRRVFMSGSTKGTIFEPLHGGVLAPASLQNIKPSSLGSLNYFPPVIQINFQCSLDNSCSPDFFL